MALGVTARAWESVCFECWNIEGVALNDTLSRCDRIGLSKRLFTAEKESHMEDL